MHKISKWFLSQSQVKIFLLSLLGVTIYLWIFSIIYQLDKKRNNKTNPIKVTIITMLTIYPLAYMLVFLCSMFTIFLGNDIFKWIIPFHIAAMGCGVMLLIIGTDSYAKYEKAKGNTSYHPIGVFFMLWYYIIGIWVLQPKLNEYIKES